MNQFSVVEGLPSTLDDGPALLLVDFDHTLLASNSTEMFIASCRPATATSLIDLLLRRCFPWRLTGVKNWYRLRDYACVLALCLLMPWNIWLWKRRAPALFAQHRSDAVARWIGTVAPDRLIIVSFGIAPIIRALLRGSPFADTRIIATPLFSGLRRFRHGKKQLAIDAIGDVRACEAILLTDSDDDADLLAYCDRGIRISQQGPSFDARSRLYLPLRYFALVKYGRSFAIDQILLVDAALYALATIHGVADLGKAYLVSLILLVSFTCIYEIGYFENDMHAALKEAKPVLSDKVAAFQAYPIRAAWPWGIVLGAAGLIVAALLFGTSFQAMLPIFGAWIAVLIAVRIIFFVYNRMPTQKRMFVYPLLQLLKYGAIIAVFSANAFGALLIASQITTMWVTYLVYRLGGDHKKLAREAFRATIFALGALLLLAGRWRGATATGLASLGIGRADWLCLLAILVWLALRMAKSAAMTRIKTVRGAA